ncbi:uncharacterized protein LOC144118366 [Amblyomma americanum]
MVSDFPLEYMHLVCLGAMRKLLHCWVQRGSHKAKLPAGLQIAISGMLMGLQKYAPQEIAQKPRSLCELESWKATEFINFLFYFGPAVLKNNIEKCYYNHYMKLSVALFILACPALCQSKLNAAGPLLREFVVDAESLYGEGIYVYNIHSLGHLPADVKKYGYIDSFSAFRFESFLGELKQDLKSANRPLLQIVKRVYEQNELPRACPVRQTSLHKPLGSGLTLPRLTGEQFRKINLPDMVAEVNTAHSSLLVEDGNVAVATNVLSRDGDIAYAYGRFFTQLPNFHQGIADTTELHHYKASGPSRVNAVWPFQKVRSKYSYEVARRRALRAQDQSDLTSEPQPVKRARRPPKQLEDFTSESDTSKYDSIHKSSNDDCTEFITQPSQPPAPKYSED